MNHVDVAPFEAKFRADPDPWRFATSDYEQRKYDLSAATLPRRRYSRAFEPGCAIGELTKRLAGRCDQVEAIDASPTACRLARDTCAGLTNVNIAVGELPSDWPAGTFDLIVLSEIGYYFDLPALAALRDRAVDCLEPGGTLLAVHWRGRSDDHLLSGDAVHGCLRAGLGLQPLVRHHEPDFILDAWERT